MPTLRATTATLKGARQEIHYVVSVAMGGTHMHSASIV